MRVSRNHAVVRKHWVCCHPSSPEDQSHWKRHFANCRHWTAGGERWIDSRFTTMKQTENNGNSSVVSGRERGRGGKFSIRSKLSWRLTIVERRIGLGWQCRDVIVRWRRAGVIVRQLDSVDVLEWRYGNLWECKSFPTLKTRRWRSRCVDPIA